MVICDFQRGINASCILFGFEIIRMVSTGNEKSIPAFVGDVWVNSLPFQILSFRSLSKSSQLEDQALIV